MATILKGHFIIVEVNASSRGDYYLMYSKIECLYFSV
jgi:hypothetical protein